jgi:hypothetical protein
MRGIWRDNFKIGPKQEQPADDNFTPTSPHEDGGRRRAANLEGLMMYWMYAGYILAFVVIESVFFTWRAVADHHFAFW